MSMPGTWGLQATYHQVLDKLELLVPEKWRLMYSSQQVLEEYFSGLQLVKERFTWSRHSLIIIPPNWSRFADKFFVTTARSSHLFHIWRYNQIS
ncbi:hypothetical protein Celaphus_00017499 [Cervus elaphus hippelaphus]|uniref:Uncharacterized protein n=1 Tax=Cervus elaphus hippelaphus TaxID=46360 RepID=A0A212D6A8_CEREH|nr:hypothetical protein Celaphus_00017499 [Cervus elaphus hippelaphus]